jgi:hypothetical protein
MLKEGVEPSMRLMLSALSTPRVCLFRHSSMKRVDADEEIRTNKFELTV